MHPYFRPYPPERTSARVGSMLRQLLSLTVLVGVSVHSQDEESRLKSLQLQLEQIDAQRAALLAPIEQTKLKIMQRDLAAKGLPALVNGDNVIVHPGHSLVWSARHEQPKWTAHIVTPDIIHGALARIDTFLPDPLVPRTDLFSLYWNSGYDRGHQVPSADMRWSLDAMTATYYYSNISPQVAEMNRGAWADLEDWGRRYVRYSTERAFVLTGPVLEEGLPTLPSPDGGHHVSVPRLFWKVIADLDGPDMKGIAFVMSNAAHDEPPISFAVPIDSVEKLTGIDFFPGLDDVLEARLESAFEVKTWYAEGDPNHGEVPPLKAPLPRGMFNTVQARFHVGNTATICGTVVSTRRTQKANAVYLNLDRNFPNQDFYATVWDSNGPNFSYDPEAALLNKTVCITGKVTLYDDIPRISVNNESEITFWEEVGP